MRRVLILASGLLLAGSLAAQPGGMNFGMMGARDGFAMGPGMMGGGYGMGPGLMWGGYGGDALAGLDLSAEQRKQIAKIQEELSKSHWQLMGPMDEQGRRMFNGFGPGSLDEVAARKAFDSMQAAQKSMFELSLRARKSIDAVLTPKQREQLRSDWGSH